MPLSPADVHNVAFSKPPIGKRGYNEDEVDQFLDLVEDALAQLQDENEDLQAQVSDLSSQSKTGAGAAGTATAASTRTDEAALRKEIEAKLRAEYETKLADSKSEVSRAKEETKKAQEQVKAAQAEASKAQASGSAAASSSADLKAARDEAAQAKKDAEAARAEAAQAKKDLEASKKENDELKKSASAAGSSKAGAAAAGIAGAGVAQTADGKTVFVSGGAVPGDVVRARLTDDGERFSRATLTEVLEPSPERIASPLSFVALTGATPWGNMTYESQLREKKAGIVSALERIGHFSPKETSDLVRDIVAPGEPWGYRNKIELAFKRVGRKTLVGMYAPNGQDIVRIKDCPLLDKAHEKIVGAVSGALSYLSGSHELDIERIGIRTSRRTKDVEVALWTAPGGFPRAQVARVLEDATGATSIVRVMTKGSSKARRIAGVERLSGAGSWSELIGDERMRVSAPSFFQVNTKGAEKLVELVLSALDVRDSDEAMDLYCGAGTFTLPLARRVGFVSAVESYGPAVRDLRRNLEDAGWSNVDAIRIGIGKRTSRISADGINVTPAGVHQIATHVTHSRAL